ncbi:MAG: S8 family serine peptidase, partial [Bacteroidales bacterium]|nr:S8 family serine peptidase [Bacteroidales bacterium]
MVKYAQPAFFHYVSLDGYDSNPEFENQWNLKDTTEILGDQWGPTTYKYGINAIRAWSFTSGNPDIRIAVLDDGVLGNHEDLVDNVIAEKIFTNDSLSYMINARKHGTKCMGIISSSNNNKGLLGVAHTCKVVSLITMYYLANVDTLCYNDEKMADAICYACDSMNVSIFSCSWKINNVMTEIYLSAIDYAIQNGRHGKGCVIVFCSGNRRSGSQTEEVSSNASLSNVLSVGGTTEHGYRVSLTPFWNDPDPSWESCYGDSLDLMAPGYGISTTCYSSNDCYTSFEGTSAAAPHVAGVAALVLSIDSTLTHREVFEILCSTATKVHHGEENGYVYASNPAYPYGTWNNEMGYGLVNAHHAILKTLYRDYYMTGTSEIGLCETGSYHVHGTTPFNDSITCGWSSSSNIEILSTTDSLVARGTRPGPGWVAFNIIHDNDSLPLVFPVNVTNGGITILSNHEFTGNVTLSSPHFTDADLIIDSLATLTITDTLYIAGDRNIIVRPGGKLIVNGGTLTSACDGEMWQGIIVEGNPSLPQYAQRQGSVILNNATIENARNAISTRGADTNAVYEHTGGIVQATNTLFRNNRRTAEFLEYENHSGSNVTDNVSHFTRCTFTVDDDNLFASNGTSFLEHVSLWKVRGVKFNGCDFRNETTGSSTRGAGILSIEAGFTAKRVCPQLSNSDPCGCYNSGSDTV